MTSIDNLKVHHALKEKWKRQVFRDELGNRYSVGLLHLYATEVEGLKPHQFPINIIERAELMLLKINPIRLLLCDCDAPVLLLMQNSGRLSLPDGRHRVVKAKYLKRRHVVGAFVVPWLFEVREYCKIHPLA